MLGLIPRGRVRPWFVGAPTHSHTLHPSQVPLSAGVELWISSLLSSLRSSLHQLLMSAITHDRGGFSLEECVHHNITQVATMALFFHWAKECELVRRTAAKVHYPKAATKPPSSLLPPLPHVLTSFYSSFSSFSFHFHPSSPLPPPLLSPPLLSLSSPSSSSPSPPLLPLLSSLFLSLPPPLLPPPFLSLPILFLPPKALSQCRYDRRALPGARGKFSAWSVGKLSSLLMRHTWRTSEELITPLHRLRLEAMTTVSRERMTEGGGSEGGGKGGGESLRTRQLD